MFEPSAPSSHLTGGVVGCGLGPSPTLLGGVGCFACLGVVAEGALGADPAFAVGSVAHVEIEAEFLVAGHAAKGLTAADPYRVRLSLCVVCCVVSALCSCSPRTVVGASAVVAESAVGVGVDDGRAAWGSAYLATHVASLPLWRFPPSPIAWSAQAPMPVTCVDVVLGVGAKTG